MSWKPWMSALLGLAAGAGMILLLPQRVLFHGGDPHAGNSHDFAGTRFACPMMCFIGNQPTACPVCGMMMTPVTVGDLNPEQTKRIGLETARVAAGSAVLSVRAVGRVEYDHRFTRLVIPRVSGRILQRHEATFGCCEAVGAGDPVIDLYSTEVIAAQGELQAALRLGDQRLIASLRERFSRWNLDEVAEAILAGDPIQDTITIRSPFDGTVLLQDEDMLNDALAVGREIAADMPLLRLVNPDRLVLILEIPEHRARWLAEGQRVLVESDDFGPLPQLDTRINRLSTEIEPLLRTRQARIYFDNSNVGLLPGSLVNARIEAALGPDLRPADPDDSSTWGVFVLVPKAAVLSTGIRNVAWRITGRQSDGRVAFGIAPLALGPRIEDRFGNDYFIVRAGLQVGDEVATTGAFLIDSQAQLAGTPSLIYPAGASQTGDGHQH